MDCPASQMRDNFIAWRLIGARLSVVGMADRRRGAEGGTQIGGRIEPYSHLLWYVPPARPGADRAERVTRLSHRSVGEQRAAAVIGSKDIMPDNDLLRLSAQIARHISSTTV